jgi:hypothetical protein
MSDHIAMWHQQFKIALRATIALDQDRVAVNRATVFFGRLLPVVKLSLPFWPV